MAIKKSAKKATKKVKKTTKSAPKKTIATNPAKNLQTSLVELIKNTSAVLPDDVQKVILEALHREEKNTTAEYAMNIIKANIDLAKKKSQPLCQDTGTVLFYVSHPVNFDQNKFTKEIQKAVVVATKLGYLKTKFC